MGAKLEYHKEHGIITAEEGHRLVAEDVQAEFGTLFAVAPELLVSWKDFLSAQDIISKGGYMDNPTDVHRARDRQAKAIRDARAAIAEAESQ